MPYLTNMQGVRVAPITFHPCTEENELSYADFSDLTGAERDRLMEVALHEEVRAVSVDGRNDEGFLVATFDEVSEFGTRVYEVLYIDRIGRVAQADTNQPVYHDSFAAMVEAVNVAGGEAQDAARQS